MVKVRSISLKRFTLTLLLAVAMCATVVAGEQEYDESTPLEELKEAASGGDTEAMLEYGMRLAQGQGVDTSFADAMNWFQKAVDAGDAQGWYAMGFVYSNGVGVDLDLPKSVGYYRKGAEAGDADCQTAMGMFYQAGDKFPSGINTDPVEAAKWYRMAAEQDHTEAIQHLAVMHGGRMGLERNEEEALRWYRKGAELGSADCIWGLGRCYLKGSGVKADSVTAYALFSASLDGVEFPEQKKAMTARRDELGRLLTAEQLKQAEPITEQWKSKIKN